MATNHHSMAMPAADVLPPRQPKVSSKLVVVAGMLAALMVAASVLAAQSARAGTAARHRARVCDTQAIR
jgi:hypothetical protein